MPDTSTLEQRIHTLERQNRQFKMLGATALILGLLVVIMGQAAAQTSPGNKRVIEAEAFVIKDKEGKPRGAFRVRPDGTAGLYLLDQEGSPRVMWRVFPSGDPALHMLTAKGRPIAVLAQTSEGAMALHLHSKSDRDHGSFVVLPDGTTGLSHFDNENKPRGGLWLTRAASPELRLQDDDGNITFKAP